MRKILAAAAALALPASSFAQVLETAPLPAPELQSLGASLPADGAQSLPLAQEPPSLSLSAPLSEARSLEAPLPLLERARLTAAAAPLAAGLAHARLFDGALAAPRALAGLGAAPETLEAPMSKPGRLPETASPTRYDLKLRVDPDAGVFSGDVEIKARLKGARVIVLHSLDLEIKSASVNGRAVQATVDKANQTVTLRLDAPLRGAASIRIAYSGAMNKQMVGLYESTAKTGGKVEKYAFTKFEPTHARRMLPCFDEPASKAAFRLTLTAPERLTLLSNMPAVKESAEGGWKTTEFAESPKMSTYLLAFAAGNLVAKSKAVQGTTVSVWASPEEISQADFALESAERALRFLNRYFGLKYQLPKLDLIAVPDFQSGAMENWGAIFFRDSALLVDSKLSSSRARRRVAYVIFHEIVHQWFGNLVTMSWWNDLWLNEAFATWLGWRGVNDWKPEWGVPVERQQSKQDPLNLDALENTRAISAEANTPAQIDAMFDGLTYEKGAGVLAMLEGWLGAKAFREGIRIYMRRHRYGNTEAGDLWKALEKSSGRPVGSVARGWLEQAGYPIVDARLEGRVLRWSQRRFRSDGSNAPGRWALPVKIKYQLEGETKVRVRSVVLQGPSGELRLPGRAAWIYANAAGTGFFRLALPESLQARLLRAPLEETEKIGLLGDLWARAKAGESSIGAFLDALSAFAPKGGRALAEDAVGYLNAISEKLVTPEDRPAFSRLIHVLLDAQRKKAGWAGGSEDQKLLRGPVLWALAATAGDRKLLEDSENWLDAYLLDPKTIDPALVATLLNLGARGGSEARFDNYLERLRNAATPEQKNQYYRAFAEFRQPELRRRWLEFILSNEVRGQDAWIPLQHLLRRPDSQGQAWEFVKAHWPELKEKMGSRGVRRVVEALDAVSTQDRFEDVRAFFSQSSLLPDSESRTLAQTLDAIRLTLAFKKAQSAALAAWLKD